MVGDVFSLKSFWTKRRTSDDLPTAASPVACYSQRRDDNTIRARKCAMASVEPRVRQINSHKQSNAS